jgi:hypothetical protein
VESALALFLGQFINHENMKGRDAAPRRPNILTDGSASRPYHFKASLAGKRHFPLAAARPPDFAGS